MLLFRQINTYVLNIILIFASCITLVLQKKYNIFFWKYTLIGNKINKQKISLSQQEILKLQNTIIKLQYENQKLNEYKNIYNALANKYTINAIAEIMYINKNNNGHYMLATTNKKVKINNLVIDENQKLVGRITDVYNNNVKIQLLSDKYSNIPVYADNSNGIIYGTGIKQCKIAYQNLSQTYPKDGELVITSGDEGLTRRGVIVGTLYTYNNTKCIHANLDYNINQVAIIE